MSIVRIVIAVSVVVLAACSTPSLTTQVNSFQQLPSSLQGKTVAFKQDMSQNLEQKAYADQLVKEMWKTGLVQTPSVKKADYLLSFAVVKEKRDQLVRDYYDYPMFYPNLGFGFGSWGFSPYWGVNMAYFPRVTTYNVTYYRHILAVKLQTQKGQEVYRAQAFVDTEHDNVMDILPFLSASIFDEFPGANGQSRQVSFDIEKSQQYKTPVKMSSQ